MNNLDIVQYIRHGMILRNFEVKETFDAIVYESFANKEIDVPEHMSVETLDTTDISGINAQLLALTENYERICIVLDSLSLSDILPYIRSIQAKNEESEDSERRITIINIGAGASGLLHKGFADIHDVTIALEYSIPTFEPHDFISLFTFFEQDQESTSYIRIPYMEYPGNLLPEVEISVASGMTDLTAYELSGNYATLVCYGGHITSCIQAYTALKEQAKACDIFLAHRYTLPNMHEGLLSSLEKTKQLIVILDQHVGSGYTHYITSWLYNQGVTDLKSLHFITPDISAITTNQPHALYEQAGLGAIGIVENILEK